MPEMVDRPTIRIGLGADFSTCTSAETCIIPHRGYRNNRNPRSIQRIIEICRPGGRLRRKCDKGSAIIGVVVGPTVKREMVPRSSRGGPVDRIEITIRVLLAKIGQLARVDRAKVGFSLRHLRLRLELEEVRDGDGRQDSDDRDDDHQLDQGEAFSVSLSQQAQHKGLLSGKFFICSQ